MQVGKIRGSDVDVDEGVRGRLVVMVGRADGMRDRRSGVREFGRQRSLAGVRISRGPGGGLEGRGPARFEVTLLTMAEITVRVLGESEWSLYREVRLRALRVSRVRSPRLWPMRLIAASHFGGTG